MLSEVDCPQDNPAQSKHPYPSMEILTSRTAYSAGMPDFSPRLCEKWVRKTFINSFPTKCCYNPARVPVEIRHQTGFPPTTVSSSFLTLLAA
jgi:hypothetical protein